MGMRALSLALGVFVGSLLGCESSPPATKGAPVTEEAPPAPPDLRIVTPVKSAMWHLAEKTNTMGALLDKPQPLGADDMAALKVIVDDIAKTGAGLAVDPAAMKHWRVKAQLPAFQATVTKAQAALAMDAPTMAAVEAIERSCVECHNHGKRPPRFTW